MPALSIITVNLNNAEGLQKTIRSVTEQTFADFEWLIIDGASTDGSLAVIKEHEARITHWVSETDSGIYEAMNKGIRLARGSYLLFLNSGDWLATPGVLAEVFAQMPEADLVAGDINYYDSNTKTIRWQVRSPEELTAKTLFLGTLPHQATFIRRSLFDRVGLYNQSLRIAADWLFFLDARLTHQCTYRHHRGIVAYFNTEGISCRPATATLPRQEQLQVLRMRYPHFLPDYERWQALEEETSRWEGSGEYRVYQFLKRLGVIRAGVYCRKAKRSLRRNLFPARIK